VLTGRCLADVEKPSAATDLTSALSAVHQSSSPVVLQQP
jgi:hypothetical protein